MIWLFYGSIWHYWLKISNSIHRHNFEFSWAVWGENLLYVSRGGYFSSTSIPMGGLSNRCNRCSMPKRRKSSSESGLLWSAKESNLFKCSLLFYISLKGALNLRELFMIFRRRREFFMELSLNQQIKFN